MEENERLLLALYKKKKEGIDDSYSTYALSSTFTTDRTPYECNYTSIVNNERTKKK